MALLELYGPLQRVRGIILNAIQRATLDQRGSGTDNTLTTNINNVSTSWDCGRVQMAVDRPIPAGPNLTLDNTKDWRDRQLWVSFRFDPVRDIRPGEADDHCIARDRGGVPIYTTLGNQRWALGPSMTLFVDASGVLRLEKGLGYAYLEITTSTQLKERS